MLQRNSCDLVGSDLYNEHELMGIWDLDKIILLNQFHVGRLSH